MSIDTEPQRAWPETAVRHFDWEPFGDEISQGDSGPRAVKHGPDHVQVYALQDRQDEVNLPTGNTPIAVQQDYFPPTRPELIQFTQTQP